MNKNNISRRQLVRFLGAGSAAIAATGAASSFHLLAARGQTATVTPTSTTEPTTTTPVGTSTTTPEVTASPAVTSLPSATADVGITPTAAATLEATGTATSGLTETPTTAATAAATETTITATATSAATETPNATASPTVLPTATATAPAQPDPQMQAVLDQLMALHAPKITDMTPFNARQTAPLNIAVQSLLAQQNKPAQEAVAAIDHKLIPGGGGQQMLIRIYYPAGNGPFPALVYFHGGGFVIANLDTYDASCRALTNAAGCAVISVAYRQAPEYRFPAAPADAYAAYRWVLQNASSIRVDPAKVAVGGESAGGNLATVTAMQARDRGLTLPVHQLLVYPATNMYLGVPSPNFPSYAENAAAMPLATPALLWFYRLYLRRGFDVFNPYASPLRGNAEGLPSATVITAQIDPLRDEGEAYAAKLSAAGVSVTSQRYAGVTHEFFGLGGVVDKAKQAVVFAADNLKTAFG